MRLKRAKAVGLDVTAPAAIAPSSMAPIKRRQRKLVAGERFHSHQHSWDQLAVSLNGSVLILMGGSGGQAQFVSPSRSAWIPAGQTHALEALTDCTYVSLYLDPLQPLFSSREVKTVELRRFAVELIGQLDSHTMENTSARYRAIVFLLYEELRSGLSQGDRFFLPFDKRLNAVCNHVFDHLGERESNAAIAARYGLSARTLSRLSRNQLGTSFAHWRSLVTLSFARTLLQDGLPIALVAYTCGFSSVSAFHLRFKSLFKASPGRFRQDS